MNKRYALASVKAPDGEAPDAFPGEFDVILSTPELDRDKESIEARAFEPLPEHMTFDVDHGMTTETTVGSGVPTYESVDGVEVLRVRGTWSSLPRAQAVRTLVKEGHIRTTSVAYMDAVYEQKDGVPTVTKAELLNGAFVAIPSNRGARVLSAKAYAERLAEAGPVLKETKADRLQQIHDLSVGNGATCSTKTARGARAGKVPGMSNRDLEAALAATVESVHGGDRRWTWVRDFGDDWVVFTADGMDPVGMFRQAFNADGGVITLDGAAEPVRARTVYEPLPEQDDGTPIKSTTEGTPETADTPSAKSPASAVTRARLALGEAALTLSIR